MTYHTVASVAAELHVSERTIGQYVRDRRIPHRKLPGVRRVLFPADELEAWMGGAELEEVRLSGGGRVVRPKLCPRT